MLYSFSNVTVKQRNIIYYFEFLKKRMKSEQVKIDGGNGNTPRKHLTSVTPMRTRVKHLTWNSCQVGTQYIPDTTRVFRPAVIFPPWTMYTGNSHPYHLGRYLIGKGSNIFLYDRKYFK